MTVVRIPGVATLVDDTDFLCIVWPFDILSSWQELIGITGKTTDFAILSTVEVGVGIVAACVATLRPLLTTVITRTRRGSRRQEQAVHHRSRNPKSDQLRRGASQDNLKANPELATMTFFIDDRDSVVNLGSSERSDVELGVIHETMFTT